MVTVFGDPKLTCAGLFLDMCMLLTVASQSGVSLPRLPSGRHDFNMAFKVFTARPYHSFLEAVQAIFDLNIFIHTHTRIDKKQKLRLFRWSGYRLSTC